MFLEFIGLPKFLEFINRMLNIDMNALHKVIGLEAQKIVEERFDNSEDPAGIKWDPIKSYIYRSGNIKLARGPGDSPLKAGLGSPPLANSIDFDAFINKVVIGTVVDYAKYHSEAPPEGTRHKKNREFLGFESDGDFDRLEREVVDFMQTLVA